MKPKHLLSTLTIVMALFSCDNDEAPKTVPIVTTSPPTDVTTMSATVGGNIVDAGNDVVSKSGIVYSSNVAMPTTADNKIESTVNTGAFSVSLTGLSSGTTYHIRAFATNGLGTSYGEVVDLTTGNAAPIASNILITGVAEVNKVLTATYKYDDSEKDAEGETTFQWYQATTATGTNETAIDGAVSKTFTIKDEQNGKFLRVSVTPKAKTGTTTGLEVKSQYTGAVGSETVTFVYNGSEVTYGTITSTTTQKKWLDRNLGAGRRAESVDDYLAYGDMFQWGRSADGHQLVIRTGINDTDVTGVNGTTSTTAPYETSADDTPETNKFIVIKGSPGDWRVPFNNDLWQGVSGINNPCPAGWRIPTVDEWTAETITNASDAFDKLKLTYTGQRGKNSGVVSLSTSGLYWSSTPLEFIPGSWGSAFASFDATTFGTNTTNRAMAQGCRCVKD
jgi:hypothetical protein